MRTSHFACADFGKRAFRESVKAAGAEVFRGGGPGIERILDYLRERE